LVWQLTLWTIVLASPWEAAAKPEASVELASRVQSLVRQLNDRNLDQRQAAEETLKGLGVDALPHIPGNVAGASAEVKERLDRVREHLERLAAAAIVQPSRVTLHGEMSVEEALHQVQQQTGNRLSGYAQRPGRVTLDCERVLFWEVLDRILDAGGLDVNSSAGQPQTLVLVARPANSRPRSNAGVYQEAFRIQPVRVEARRDLRVAEVDALRVTLEIAWEPRLAPIAIRQSLKEVRAWADGDWQFLATHSRGVLSAATESGISSVEIAIPLPLPQRQVTRIARMAGNFEAMLPGRVEHFEFTEPFTKGAPQRRASVCVTLDRWRKNGNVQEASVRVKYDDPGTALDSHRGWIYRNKAFLLKPDGSRVDPAEMRLAHQGPDEIGIDCAFDLAGNADGYRFCFEAPASIERTSVQYELSDIPLP
jgi:hypothetical protein